MALQTDRLQILLHFRAVSRPEHVSEMTESLKQQYAMSSICIAVFM